MAAVFAVDVLNDLFTALVLKVDVDVGRLIALSADETAEQQVHVFGCRVDLRHAQAITDHRVGRAAPALAQDALAARPVHDVGNGQKVRRKGQLGNQGQLLFDGLQHLLGCTVAKAPLHTGLRQCPQPTVRRVAGRHDLLRVFVAQLGERKFAGRRHRHTGGQPLRPVQRRQALARTQVRLGIGLQRQATGADRQVEPGGGEHILQRLARPAVHQHITRSHQRQAAERGHPRQHGQPVRILGTVQQLHRDGAAAGFRGHVGTAKPGLEPHGMGKHGLERLPRLRQQQGKTPGQASQERRLRHPALHIRRIGQVVALGRPAPRHADPLRQVAVTTPVLRQQHQVWRGVASQHRAATCRRWRELEMRADDQVQAQRLGGLMRTHHAGQRAFIRQRQRTVATPQRLGHQFSRLGRTGQKTEIAAAVQLSVLRQRVMR